MARTGAWKPTLAIALCLMVSGAGGLGRDAGPALAAPAKPSATPKPKTAPAKASVHEPAPLDPAYYAYATQYYLQYLSSREQAEANSQDPFFYFHYYQYYRERYAPGSDVRSAGTAVPAWFATMPFRNARTQAFARFVQVASPSVDPTLGSALASGKPVAKTAGK